MLQSFHSSGSGRGSSTSNKCNQSDGTEAAEMADTQIAGRLAAVVGLSGLGHPQQRQRQTAEPEVDRDEAVASDARQ